MPPSEIIRGGRSASRSSANRPHGPVRQTRSKSASVESKSSSVESKSSKSASVAHTRSKYRKSASVNDSFAIKSPSDPPMLHHPHGTMRQTRSKSASAGRKSRKSATVKKPFPSKALPIHLFCGGNHLAFPENKGISLHPLLLLLH